MLRSIWQVTGRYSRKANSSAGLSLDVFENNRYTSRLARNFALSWLRSNFRDTQDLHHWWSLCRQNHCHRNPRRETHGRVLCHRCPRTCNNQDQEWPEVTRQRPSEGTIRGDSEFDTRDDGLRRLLHPESKERPK